MSHKLAQCSQPLPQDPITGLPSGVPVNKVSDRVPGAKPEGDENIDGEEIPETELQAKTQQEQEDENR